MYLQDKSIMAEIERSGLERIAEVEDPVVRRQLTPNHPLDASGLCFQTSFILFLTEKMLRSFVTLSNL